MKASCYLVLECITNRGGDIVGFKIVKATRRPPPLTADQARIFCTLEADPDIFDPELVGTVVDAKSVTLALAPAEPET